MSKYEKLTGQLIQLISANLKEGIAKLPTEAELCQKYQVSRQTVRTSLALLKKKGIIRSTQGSGSYATGLLAAPSQNTIPILIASEEEYLYPTLLSDIRETLAKQGYELKALPTGNKTHIEREHLLHLLSDPPRGLIVEGCKSAFPNPNLDLYTKLRQGNTFLLFLHNRYAQLPDAICVKDDNHYGGYLLAKYLIQSGHGRIAGLFKADDQQGLERYLGAASCLRDFGYVMQDHHVGWFHTEDMDALETKQDTRFITDFIKTKLSPCSAVICHNDEVAYWLVKELQYANLQVPRNISVVSFDNSYLSEASSVRLTSLSHAPREVGTCAAECMIQKLKGLSVVSQEIPWQLVIRESASPCQTPMASSRPRGIPSAYTPESF